MDVTTEDDSEQAEDSSFDGLMCTQRALRYTIQLNFVYILHISTAWLMVRGSQVALKHVIHDMETRTLEMELRRRAIKRWVPCGDMDRRLKIPHSVKAECGYRTIPEECLYDSGPIGPSV